MSDNENFENDAPSKGYKGIRINLCISEDDLMYQSLINLPQKKRPEKIRLWCTLGLMELSKRGNSEGNDVVIDEKKDNNDSQIEQSDASTNVVIEQASMINTDVSPAVSDSEQQQENEKKANTVNENTSSGGKVNDHFMDVSGIKL